MIQADQEDIKGPYKCRGQWGKDPLQRTPRNEACKPHREMTLRVLTIIFEDDGKHRGGIKMGETQTTELVNCLPTRKQRVSLRDEK